MRFAVIFGYLAAVLAAPVADPAPAAQTLGVTLSSPFGSFHAGSDGIALIPPVPAQPNSGWGAPPPPQPSSPGLWDAITNPFGTFLGSITPKPAPQPYNNQPYNQPNNPPWNQPNSQPWNQGYSPSSVVTIYVTPTPW
ncbi:hypothetical protein EJ06DRAFT_580106 [Trichodelitschia bisporula]|uniref:Uncharacterized protein n=1 Tax=Trichodelitschia bisporula TaxID=703511 RepID=A0A6G1I4H9_9PEZI|nr:hypothetical protein EJ06DRAFT_580106 [Trichodelitschia bisporula]